MKSKTDDKLKDNVQATEAQRHEGENSRFTFGDAVTVKYDELQIPGVVTGWVRRSVNIDTGITVCVRLGECKFILVDAARVKKAKTKTKPKCGNCRVEGTLSVAGNDGMKCWECNGKGTKGARK